MGTCTNKLQHNTHTHSNGILGFLLLKQKVRGRNAFRLLQFSIRFQNFSSSRDYFRRVFVKLEEENLLFNVGKTRE